MYGHGISKVGEVIDLGVKAGIVEKSGAWLSYNGAKIGQGRENAKAFLTENPKLLREIEQKVRQNAGLLSTALLADAEDEDELQVDEDGVIIEADTADVSAGKSKKASG